MVLQITWTTNGKSQVRHKTIKGFYCKKESWDFQDNEFLHSDRKNKLLKIYLAKAKAIYEDMADWDYNNFVSLLDNNKEEKPVENKKIIELCLEMEKYFLSRRQVGYSENFKAIASFLSKCFPNDVNLRTFSDRHLNVILDKIDERKIKGYSYLKFFKIVMCHAISEGYIAAANCPIKTVHNKRGYDIEKHKNKQSEQIKKNRIKDLTNEEKDMVIDFYYNSDLPSMQKKHLAFWVVGYKLFGVNFKDLALMKWSDINNGMWDYSRSKTGVSSDSDKPIIDDVMEILKKYDSGGKYILEVLNGYDHDAVVMQKRLHNYKSNIRRSLKKISEKIGFSDDRYITWYSTRYTAPTLALTDGVDLNTVRTLMDHNSVKSTAKYLGRVKNRDKLTDVLKNL